MQLVPPPDTRSIIDSARDDSLGHVTTPSSNTGSNISAPKIGRQRENDVPTEEHMPRSETV